MSTYQRALGENMSYTKSYPRSRVPVVGGTQLLRTQNPSERLVIQRLDELGFSVVKRGWPDLLAWRGSEVRLIEVKPDGASKLSPVQEIVAEQLLKAGLAVELVSPRDLSKLR